MKEAATIWFCNKCWTVSETGPKHYGCSRNSFQFQQKLVAPDTTAIIEAVLSKITQGEWLVAPGHFIVADCLNRDPSSGIIVAEVPCQGANDNDLPFIAAAPAIVRSLLDRNTELQQRVIELQLEIAGLRVKPIIDAEKKGENLGNIMNLRLHQEGE